MGFDFGKSDRDRDAKLRRQLLNVLNLSRAYAPSGGLSGTRLMSLVTANQPDDMGFTGDEHFLQLCRDLKNLDLVNWIDETRRRGELFGPRHVSLSITGKGTQLVDEVIAPIPGIDDERIAGDA